MSRYPSSLWLNMFLIPALLCTAANAADLQPETVKAWTAYTEATEQRIATEVSSPNGFLALDFKTGTEAKDDRRALLAGKTLIEQVKTYDRRGRAMEIPEGTVHHWRGAIFVPGATLEDVLDRLRNPVPADAEQEDVLAYKVLEKSPGQYRIYLKLQRSKIVTVVYNTEHLVRYRLHGNTRVSSSSVATKIAEVERRNNVERELPQGHDSGFLWRMNSYWRYEKVDGGVIMECESMTLSRSIPAVIQVMARPLIKGVARESMQRTLETLRGRMAGLLLARTALQSRPMGE